MEKLTRFTNKKKEETETLLRFLRRTKSGKYTEVTPVVMKCVRLSDMRGLGYDEDVYTYSYS